MPSTAAVMHSHQHNADVIYPTGLHHMPVFPGHVNQFSLSKAYFELKIHMQLQTKLTAV